MSRFLINTIIYSIFLVIGAAGSTAGAALIPESIHYQGYLADASGAPIDDTKLFTFSIYNVESGGTPLTTRSMSLTVEQGLFSAEISGPFPAGMFDTTLWLGVSVDADEEMVPRRLLTSVGFAFKADDAFTLTGQSAAELDQSVHVSDTENPHAVTTAHTGAATPADIADLQMQLDSALAAIASLQSVVTALETDLAAEVVNRIADVNAEEASRIATDGTHDTAIADIQANTVLALDGRLTLSGGDTALFDGVNVQVVDGTGTTIGANGLGNVIVGYDEASSGPSVCSLGNWDNQADCELGGGVWAASHKTGSHNIVVGRWHNYSRFGGLVVGDDNDITGDWASVSGGVGNAARGRHTSVSGGEQNTALLGSSAVSGGLGNTAFGSWSTVSGGIANTASGSYSIVAGGITNTASGSYSIVAGGRNNIASGESSSVLGGGDVESTDGNEAFADYSAILGGRRNRTGDGIVHSVGPGSTVSGGQSNTATGNRSSVSGGNTNTASGHRSSVTGGRNNVANNIGSTISGGQNNTASGIDSSVSGGQDNLASGDLSSISGGLANTASGPASSVTGGFNNEASGQAGTIGGGDDVTSSVGNDWAGEGDLDGHD